MRRFFEEHRLDNDGLSEDRVSSIKRSVLSRVEGVKPLKKRKYIKPLVIAAALTATAAVSTIAVGAASNGEPTYSVKINGENVPFTVEEFEKKDVTFTFEATGDTIDAYETGIIIKYELPEEIVISDSRQVTYSEINVCAADDGRPLSSYGGFSDGHIEKLPGLPFSTSVKNSWLFNMTTIEIEYDLSMAYSTKTTE